MRIRRANAAVGCLVATAVVAFLLLSGEAPARHDPRSRLAAAQGEWTAPRQSLVFIKMFKGASTTVNTIFYRYGETHDLRFALPPKSRVYLGWPFFPTVEDVALSPHAHGPPQLWLEHSRYNRSIMSRIMQDADTVYVTTLRQPWSHFLSVFNYFDVRLITNLGNSPLKVPDGPEAPLFYLQHFEELEAIYKSDEPAVAGRRYCVNSGVSILENLQAFCLGVPLGNFGDTGDLRGDEAAIQRYIGRLDREFDLVMLVERLPESLVLLRRVMHWQLTDVLYYTKNRLQYRSSTKLSPAILAAAKALHRRINKVDFALYEYFAKRLDERIAAEDASFVAEVEIFRDYQQRLQDFCGSSTSSDHASAGEAYEDQMKLVADLKKRAATDTRVLRLPATAWSKEATFSALDCLHMVEPGLERIQDKAASWLPRPTNPKPLC
eukprot:m.29735 g.29735  ORF g.29735 m.29735 type:complete len:436 (+) comp5134_c1_seq1:48-1355(+)